MRRTALFFAAALAVSPVFAADNLCTINLQKVDDWLKTSTPATGQTKQVSALRDQASQAQAKGDTEACIALSSKALTATEQPGEGGGSR
ncbi:MAG: hypothetical protein GAK44_00035 [Pseudomonas delhiensis]|nr:MAG: hypothetical protein GAK44_00035 [Pseudomonas delhiensis]